MIGTNNLFNIRAGANWLGSCGSTRGFVNFKDRRYCVRAWLVLMRTYANKYHCDTIESIVSRFAPPSENDTEGYIRFVCDYTSLSRNWRLFNSDYALLAVAMARIETLSGLSSTWVYDVMEEFNIWPRSK